MELSISSVKAQLQKYHQLLKQNCGTELVVLNYMMTYVNASHYIRKEVYGDKPEDLPEGFMVRQNAKLWYKVARLHLQDLVDMENEVTMFCKSVPDVPDRSTGRLPFEADNMPAPRANFFQVDAYTDTETIC